MRRLLVAALVVAGAASPARAQFCPCYGLGAMPNNSNCGVAPATGTNPSVADWQPIFELVSGGPARWGAMGPATGDLPSGCDRPQPVTKVGAVFPCELLRAIAMQETGWRQFCVPTEPTNMKGPPSRTIVSFDCGYGIGQVTSGMHVGETPGFDRARVAAEPAYNLATGATILAGKWRAVKCVGDRDPNVVEDWYLATWGYNGFAAKNDPNYASYDPMRPVCNPNVSCAMRPYQERVWGWMEFPPTPAHWTAIQPAYPDRTKIVYSSTGLPTDVPEPSCAGPTDCTHTRPTHVSACLAPPASDDGGVPSGADAGVGDTDGGVGPAAPGGCGCTVGGVGRAAGATRAALLVGIVAFWLLRRRAMF